MPKRNRSGNVYEIQNKRKREEMAARRQDPEYRNREREADRARRPLRRQDPDYRSREQVANTASRATRRENSEYRNKEQATPSMMAPNQNKQNDIYQLIDTVQQYSEHFSNYRKLNNPPPGMEMRN